MTTTDATHLLTNADFLSLCDVWQQRNRCPLAMIDVLIEADCEHLVPVAKWAIEEPERPTFADWTIKAGPTPKLTDRHWSWFTRRPISEADDLPIECWGYRDFDFDSFAEAIVWFLSNYNPEPQ